jgi:hypothetical protein
MPNGDLLGARRARSDDPARPYVYARTLQGERVIVIAYNVLYGGEGIPSRVVIDRFRKIGSQYALADETGTKPAFSPMGSCTVLWSIRESSGSMDSMAITVEITYQEPPDSDRDVATCFSLAPRI